MARRLCDKKVASLLWTLLECVFFSGVVLGWSWLGLIFRADHFLLAGCNVTLLELAHQQHHRHHPPDASTPSSAVRYVRRKRPCSKKLEEEDDGQPPLILPQSQRQHQRQQHDHLRVAREAGEGFSAWLEQQQQQQQHPHRRQDRVRETRDVRKDQPDAGNTEVGDAGRVFATGTTKRRERQRGNQTRGVTEGRGGEQSHGGEGAGGEVGEDAFIAWPGKEDHLGRVRVASETGVDVVTGLGEGEEHPHQESHRARRSGEAGDTAVKNIDPHRRQQKHHGRRQEQLGHRVRTAAGETRNEGASRLERRQHHYHHNHHQQRHHGLEQQHQQKQLERPRTRREANAGDDNSNSNNNNSKGGATASSDTLHQRHAIFRPDDKLPAGSTHRRRPASSPLSLLPSSPTQFSANGSQELPLLRLAPPPRLPAVGPGGLGTGGRTGTGTGSRSSISVSEAGEGEEGDEVADDTDDDDEGGEEKGEKEGGGVEDEDEDEEAEAEGKLEDAGEGVVVEEEEVVCTEQRELLRLMFAVVVVLRNLLVLPIGAFFDKYGTTRTRLLTVLILAMGTLMMTFTNKDVPWLMVPALTLTGVAGVGVLLTNIQIANLFGRRRHLVMALYCGASLSSGFIAYMMHLSQTHGVDVQTSFMFLTIGLVPMLVSTVAFLPKTRIPWPLPANYFKRRNQSLDENLLLAPPCQCLDSRHSVSGVTISVPQSGVIKLRRPTPQFWPKGGHHLFVGAMLWHGVQSLHTAQAETMLVDVGHLKGGLGSDMDHVFGWIQLLSTPLAILPGLLIDRRRPRELGVPQGTQQMQNIVPAILMTSLLAVAERVVLMAGGRLVPCLVLSFLLHVLHRVFHLTTALAFLLHVHFAQEHMGKYVSLTLAVSGVLSAFQFPIRLFLKDQPLVVHPIIITLLLLTLAHAFNVWNCCRRRMISDQNSRSSDGSNRPSGHALLAVHIQTDDSNLPANDGEEGGEEEEEEGEEPGCNSPGGGAGDPDGACPGTSGCCPGPSGQGSNQPNGDNSGDVHPDPDENNGRAVGDEPGEEGCADGRGDSGSERGRDSSEGRSDEERSDVSPGAERRARERGKGSALKAEGRDGYDEPERETDAAGRSHVRTKKGWGQGKIDRRGVDKPKNGKLHVVIREPDLGAFSIDT